jgi:autotransporter passenger strand-loop-strand repeat protein
MASSVTVSSGISYSVSSGQIDNSDSVLSGDSMFVLSGGEADATAVSAGGSLTISAGGLGFHTSISSSMEIVGSLGPFLGNSLRSRYAMTKSTQRKAGVRAAGFTNPTEEAPLCR